MQALATVAIAGWLRDSRMNRLAIPAGLLLTVAVMTVPAATPLDALLRLFAVGDSEPAAAGVIQALWVYGLPALAMAAIAWTAHRTYQGAAAGWMATALIAIGLFTRWAAFLCSGLMAAAYWMAHGLNHPLPLVNKGELAALYCFVFLFISANGPGIWSADSARSGRT